MKHASIHELPGFSKLSKAEQIRYVQALWDRIEESPASFQCRRATSSWQSNGSLTTGVTPRGLDRHTMSLNASPRSVGDRTPSGF